MFKKRYLLIVAVVPFILLNGCSIGQNTADKRIPIEKIDMSRYAKQTVEGDFKGVLNKKFVDIILNREQKTFFVADSALKQMDLMKEGDHIRFVYALNERTGQNEISSVIALNGKTMQPEIKKEQPAKNELKKEDKVKKIEMEVDYPGTTKIVKAITSDFLEGKFDVIDSYEWDGEALSNDDTEIRFTAVEDTLENDIQKERWRAADLLNESGNMKEENSDSRDAEFIFSTDTEDQYKEIMVVKNKFGYFRVETDTTSKNKNLIISELNAMLNTIK